MQQMTIFRQELQTQNINSVNQASSRFWELVIYNTSLTGTNSYYVSVIEGNVRPLRFPCIWVSFSIELPLVMNIKNFRCEVLMTATKKSDKCCHCFQVSVDSSVATWQYCPVDNTVYDILLQWEQNVTFGDIHSFLSVSQFVYVENWFISVPRKTMLQQRHFNSIILISYANLT